MTVSSVGEWRNKRWENEESTNAILKRDTGVDVHGNDKTLHRTKAEHRDHVDGYGAAELGVVGFKGLEIAEAGMPAAAEAAGGIILPFATAGLSLYGVHEALEHGKEQNAAIAKDQAHVALVGALDLPAGCKEQAFGDRSETPRGERSQAFKMTERIMKDEAGLAVLQAHCDRGVLSAYAAVPMPMPEGMTLEKFLESRPQLKEICNEDAAFRVGFEAFFKGSPAERKQLLENVQKHDVRSGQTGITVAG